MTSLVGWAMQALPFNFSSQHICTFVPASYFFVWIAESDVELLWQMSAMWDALHLAVSKLKSTNSCLRRVGISVKIHKLCGSHLTCWNGRVCEYYVILAVSKLNYGFELAWFSREREREEREDETHFTTVELVYLDTMRLQWRVKLALHLFSGLSGRQPVVASGLML